MKVRAVASIFALLMTFASTPSPTDVASSRIDGPGGGMVVTEQRLASKVGIDVLARGGNAVDAAIAVAYALAVVDPCCGNIGGGGFMLVRMHDGRERFIDFREKSPLAAMPNMFLDTHGNVVAARSEKGWLAIGVPGTVMGMERARIDFGTWPRAKLIAPAIGLAKSGFTLTSGDLIPFNGSRSQDYDGVSNYANVRAIWMPKGRFPRVGDRIVQSQLAHTLGLIARGGITAFYDGPIARDVVAASSAGGGLLTMNDFAKYSVEESQPVHCHFHGYVISSAAPPSSGGTTLCETLNIIDPYPLAKWGWHSAREAHYVAEAERRAYADRNAYLGDPAFVKNPVEQLLDPVYAAKLRSSIKPDVATPSSQVKPGLHIDVNENDDTTHYSIVDSQDNAVAVTFTINDWFGAGVIAGNTGFFLNDEMDDFTSKPGVPNMYGLVQGVRNEVRGGKRPLSSMSPTIISTNDGLLAMVTGSPGGSRIITITLETILNALVFGMSAQQAVDAPRMHMQWLPDEIQYEPNAFTAATRSALRADGYNLKRYESWGSAQAIVVNPDTGNLSGGTDRRRLSGSVDGLYLHPRAYGVNQVHLTITSATSDEH